MNSALRVEKKASAVTLSYGLPRRLVDGSKPRVSRWVRNCALADCTPQSKGNTIAYGLRPRCCTAGTKAVTIKLASRADEYAQPKMRPRKASGATARWRHPWLVSMVVISACQTSLIAVTASIFAMRWGGDRAGVIARGCAGPKRAAFAPLQGR